MYLLIHSFIYLYRIYPCVKLSSVFAPLAASLYFLMLLRGIHGTRSAKPLAQVASLSTLGHWEVGRREKGHHRYSLIYVKYDQLIILKYDQLIILNIISNKEPWTRLQTISCGIKPKMTKDSDQTNRLLKGALAILTLAFVGVSFYNSETALFCPHFKSRSSFRSFANLSAGAFNRHLDSGRKTNFVPFWGSVKLEGVHSLLWCFTNMDCSASAAYSSNQPCRHQALESNASASSLGWTFPKWVQWGQEKGYRKGRTIPRKDSCSQNHHNLYQHPRCAAQGSEAPTAPHRTGCRDSLKGSEVLVLHLGPLDDLISGTYGWKMHTWYFHILSSSYRDLLSALILTLP